MKPLILNVTLALATASLIIYFPKFLIREKLLKANYKALVLWLWISFTLIGVSTAASILINDEDGSKFFFAIVYGTLILISIQRWILLVFLVFITEKNENRIIFFLKHILFSFLYVLLKELYILVIVFGVLYLFKVIFSPLLDFWSYKGIAFFVIMSLGNTCIIFIVHMGNAFNATRATN